MSAKVEAAGMAGKIQCDSAGTAAYHSGERADSRMRQAASKRGYTLTSIARQFTPRDFQEFDLILAMDESNYSDILRQDKSGEYHGKVRKMTDFASNDGLHHVPDPYYGGRSGFDNVLDILEDSCQGLLEHLKHES